MNFYSDNIKRIAKQKENKGALGTAKSRPQILGNTKSMVGILQDDSAASFSLPLTLEVLTYDATADVSIEANNGTFVIKTAETAQIIDADGKVFPIDTIIYATP